MQFATHILKLNVTEQSPAPRVCVKRGDSCRMLVITLRQGSRNTIRYTEKMGVSVCNICK